jgi:ribA/ribD-fused uncharacterized protein
MASFLPTDIFERYFSAYSAHAIERDGVLYPTVEHAYHCARYSDRSMSEEIRSARSPLQAWEISQRYKDRQSAGFVERKVSVMEELFRLKLAQHDDVRRALLDSGDIEIRKHITSGPRADGFWDDGEDGTGENMAGKIWMRLREELRSQP